MKERKTVLKQYLFDLLVRVRCAIDHSGDLKEEARRDGDFGKAWYYKGQYETFITLEEDIMKEIRRLR